MTDAKPEHPKPEPHVPAEPKTKSKGEHTFDRFVYGGIAGVGTFIVTVPLAYLLRHHPRVTPYFEKAVDGLHRAFSKLPFEFAKKRGFSEKWLSILALMQGGNVMLLPIGWLEKHKVRIVSGLNTMLGDKTPPEKIEEAPKQTWMSLIESRLVAYFAVLGAYLGVTKLYEKSIPMFEHETGERLCQLFNKPIERTVGGATRPTKTYIFGKIGALDVFATAAAATLLYIGGHFFARRHEEKVERREGHHHHEGEVRDEAPGISATGDAADPSRAPAAAIISGVKAHGGLVASAPALAKL